MIKLGESKITEAAITGFCLQAFILFTPMQDWLSLTMAQMTAASGMLGMLIFAIIGMLRKRQKIKFKEVKKGLDGVDRIINSGYTEKEVLKMVMDRSKARENEK